MKIVTDTSLMLHLPLYEPDGDSFISRDVGGCLCTVTGASWQLQGRNFNGSTDHIVPDFTPGALGALTVEAWTRFHVQAIDMDIFHVISLGESRAISLRSNGCEIQPDGVAIGVGWHGWTGGSLPTGVYWHLAMTWNGSILTAYLNGKQDGAVVPVTGTLDAAGQSAAIGRKPYGEWWMNGIIGELRLYNRALSPQEVQHNYRVTKWRYA